MQEQNPPQKRVETSEFSDHAIAKSLAILAEAVLAEEGEHRDMVPTVIFLLLAFVALPESPDKKRTPEDIQKAAEGIAKNFVRATKLDPPELIEWADTNILPKLQYYMQMQSEIREGFIDKIKEMQTEKELLDDA